MKNAYVLEHHYGDSGNAIEGTILIDVSEVRFAELEKKGLVREATAAEVKAGSQPAFEKDDTGAEADDKKKPEPSNKKAADPANKSA